ncbi:MAG: rod shape-determining protein MreC [Spirochaetales bacterium]|nr:rod shape-determining protein MreC [Spirochaetales bacterium]
MAKKRNWGAKRNSRALKIVIALSLVVLASLFISFTESDILGILKNGGLTVVSFFQKGVSSVAAGARNQINAISELRELQRAHEEALARLNDYTGVERYVSELKRENELLREQLNFPGNLDTRHVSCEIISNDPENFFASFVINKGSKDGISRNMAVTAYQDGMYGLVGKVINVGLSSSLVMPLFDSTSFISARLQGSRYEGLIEGTGGLGDYVLMKYVTKSARSEISLGDMVITSGMKSIFPKGLNIGRVSEIFSDDYATSLRIELKPVIDFSKLEYVFVITGQEND